MRPVAGDELWPQHLRDAERAAPWRVTGRRGLPKVWSRWGGVMASGAALLAVVGIGVCRSRERMPPQSGWA